MVAVAVLAVLLLGVAGCAGGSIWKLDDQMFGRP
jgi:hypothetical protein